MQYGTIHTSASVQASWFCTVVKSTTHFSGISALVGKDLWTFHRPMLASCRELHRRRNLTTYPEFQAKGHLNPAF